MNELNQLAEAIVAAGYVQSGDVRISKSYSSDELTLHLGADIAITLRSDGERTWDARWVKPHIHAFDTLGTINGFVVRTYPNGGESLRTTEPLDVMKCACGEWRAKL
jgi:hypothetical protein